MVRNMGVARDLGYLTIPPGLLVRSDDLTGLPDDEVVLICTGSQGEPMAALSRIANGDHAITVGRGRHGDPGLLADPRATRTRSTG